MRKRIACMLIAGTLAVGATTCVPTFAGEPESVETETEVEESNVSLGEFEGRYASYRAQITIEAVGEDELSAKVSWGSSAFESAEWEMTGKYDADANGFAYSDARKFILTFHSEDDEEPTEETVYEHGRGFVSFYEKDGEKYLKWFDLEERNAEPVEFEAIPTE